MLPKFRKKKRIDGNRNIFLPAIALLFFAGLIVFLVITDYKLKQNREGALNRIEELKSQIQALEEKNENFRKDISQSNSEDYLGRIAREQLNMKALGEEVVVVKKSEDAAADAQEKMGWWDQLKSVFKFLK